MAISRLIETIGPGFFGAAPEPSTVDPRDVQPSPRASFVAAIREQTPTAWMPSRDPSLSMIEYDDKSDSVVRLRPRRLPDCGWCRSSRAHTDRAEAAGGVPPAST